MAPRLVISVGTVRYRVRSWKPCELQPLTSTLYTVVMVPMTSAQPWHLLLEMWFWQERCVTFTCNSATTSAAAVMWYTMSLIVLVLLLSVAMGDLHVRINVHYTAIAKVVVKDVVVVDSTQACLGPH